MTGDRSYYVSNIHTASLTATFSVHKLADVSLGYSHIQDIGDERPSPAATPVPGDTSLTFFRSVQTFPLRFNSPMAKLSIRLAEKVRWNAGYQFYGYREEFSTIQNYRAHTGYTSVSWAF